MSHRGPDIGRRKYLCGIADTFFKGALVWWETAAEGGITPVIAAGTEFAGVVTTASDGATTAETTKVDLSTRGSWLMPLVESDPETIYGQAVCGDVSASSDNPADLLILADAVTGDIVMGACDEWVDATEIWIDIERRNQAGLAPANVAPG